MWGPVVLQVQTCKVGLTNKQNKIKKKQKKSSNFCPCTLKKNSHDLIMRQFLYLLNKFCPLQRDHLIIEVIKYCARVCFLYILLGKWKMAAAFNLNIYKHKRKVFRSSSSCFLKDIQNAYLDVLDVVLFSVKILRSGLQGRPIHDWQRLCVCSSSYAFTGSTVCLRSFPC